MPQANPHPRFEAPAAVDEKLDQVRKRMAGLGVALAAVVALTVLLVSMALAMAVDYLVTLYDSPWRVVLTCSALAAAGGALAGWAGVALRRANRVERVAREVDRRAPELEERWGTVAQLATDPRTQAATHPAMLRRLAREASQLQDRVDPQRVAPVGGLYRAAVGLSLVAVTLGLATLLSWPRMSVLIARFWAPRAKIGRAHV